MFQVKHKERYFPALVRDSPYSFSHHREVPWPGLTSPPLLFLRLPWCRRKNRFGIWDPDLSASALLSWLIWRKIFSFAKHVFFFILRQGKLINSCEEQTNLDSWSYGPYSCPLQLDLASTTIPFLQLLKSVLLPTQRAVLCLGVHLLSYPQDLLVSYLCYNFHLCL